ncbi:hypothetical protein SacN8_01955 [Sulfolobus acidocaldarius N8]|uniref:Uncharacterized protein n=1 Tax=Sulfolobus acidocaldarius N8 TaxID=1028566 RepID=M1IN70_9CREN|nr:hypothetical protein SacN8_01955 [Sulfolobus acidocaldarius N8]
MTVFGVSFLIKKITEAFDAAAAVAPVVIPNLLSVDIKAVFPLIPSWRQYSISPQIAT